MWNTIVTTFVAVFIAELGDKTQLATLGFAAQGGSRLGVFLGSAGALCTTSLIAVAAGGFIARCVPPIYLKRGAGVLFIAIGAWTLWRAPT